MRTVPMQLAEAYMICSLHACMMHRLQIDTTLTCFRLSDSRDSGEDMKECGRGQSERHAKSWGGGGAGKRKKEGSFLSLVSSRFFCFALFYFFSCTRFLDSADATFSEPGTYESRGGVFRLPISEFRSRGVANLTHGTHVRT